MKKAFTLVEILITLSIIGVIATMTVPTLMVDVNKRIYVSQLQRTYNILKNSMVKYLQDNNANLISQTPLGVRTIHTVTNNSVEDYNNCPSSIGASNSPECAAWGKAITKNAVAPFLLGYLDVAIDCTSGADNSNCISSEYTTMDSGLATHHIMPNNKYNNSLCVLLNTGAAVCMQNPEKMTRQTAPFGVVSTNTYPVLLFIDVNGKKGPNVMGRDAFALEFFDNGKIGENFKSNGISQANGSFCSTSGYGYGCFTKIIADGWQMNY